MDRISGGVVLFLAAIILWEARNLSIGKVSAPGPGFFPTVIAIILILLSLFLIISSDGKKEEKPHADKRFGYRVIMVFLFLLAYFFLLEYLGFVVTSFLFMASLFVTVTLQKWYMAFLWAFVATGLAYLLFQILLESNLPKGVLGF